MKPSILRGTRDFLPAQVVKRNHIFDTIKNVFIKYGYQPIETPTMEELSTLTGKYGEEGDKLLFKVLNNGDFLDKVKELKSFEQKINNESLESAFNDCRINLYFSLLSNNLYLSNNKLNGVKIRDLSTKYINEFFEKNYPNKRGDLNFIALKSFLNDRTEKSISELRRIIKETKKTKKISKEEIIKTKVFSIKSMKATYVYVRNVELPKKKIQLINSRNIISSISKRGLRYDLTVPFARFVVMHQSKIAFPFKRYQIQPVWRGDKPQKGRYQEFYQCDVDVVGSDSLLYEAELIQMYDEVFAKLGIQTIIKVNNRKILFGMAEAAGIADQFMDMTVAIDKLDKIGEQGVKDEMQRKGISVDAIGNILSMLNMSTLAEFESVFANSETGLKGVEELRAFHEYFDLKTPINKVEFTPTLARGLSYYTGCIFEVEVDTNAAGQEKVKMGSIGGGGRYDDLTANFGLKGVSGVGVSFGAARIYDVMEELGLFPENNPSQLKVLFLAENQTAHVKAFDLLNQVRTAGINAALYPEFKYRKQIKYAISTSVPYVVMVEQSEDGTIQAELRNVATKDRTVLSIDSIIEKLKD